MVDQTDTTATETSTTATTDTGGTNDTGSSTEAPAAGDTSGQADDGTVLGSATTDTGAGDPKGEGKGSEESPTPTPVPDDAGVPDAYEFKLITKNEAGEDVTTELDASLVEIATPILKDVGLNNEQANKLVGLVPQIQERVLTQMNDQFATTRANWAKEAQADTEIGGKNWNETVRLSAKALDHFGAKSEIVDGKETNEFRKLLNDSGLGNHPVMLKMFRNVGAAVSEDGDFVRNTSTVEEKKSREQVNYPEDQPK